MASDAMRGGMDTTRVVGQDEERDRVAVRYLGARGHWDLLSMLGLEDLTSRVLTEMGHAGKLPRLMPPPAAPEPIPGVDPDDSRAARCAYPPCGKPFLPRNNSNRYCAPPCTRLAKLDRNRRAGCQT